MIGGLVENSEGSLHCTFPISYLEHESHFGLLDHSDNYNHNRAEKFDFCTLTEDVLISVGSNTRIPCDCTVPL